MDARGWSGCSLTLLMVNFAMPGMNGPEAIAEAKRSRPKLAVTLATRDVSKDRVEGYAVLDSDRRPCARREGCADALACVAQRGLSMLNVQRRCDVTSQLISTHRTCKPRGVCAAMDAVTHK
ncbi:hypothetical protein SBC1_29280 [Caballeronia sp. SBC1]|nr:hypothetical protein SBC1_29280 [Caballeronia sp. SBC1]